MLSHIVDLHGSNFLMKKDSIFVKDCRMHVVEIFNDVIVMCLDAEEMVLLFLNMMTDWLVAVLKVRNKWQSISSQLHDTTLKLVHVPSLCVCIEGKTDRQTERKKERIDTKH